jgi:hypothetical protein
MIEYCDSRGGGAAGPGLVDTSIVAPPPRVLARPIPLARNRSDRPRDPTSSFEIPATVFVATSRRTAVERNAPSAQCGSAPAGAPSASHGTDLPLRCAAIDRRRPVPSVIAHPLLVGATKVGRKEDQ